MSKIVKMINKKYFNLKYGRKLNLFDVSLRDGLQSINKVYTLNEKKNILHDIIKNYKPNSIEVGSIVSSKILPQMDNSVELYKYAKNINKDVNFFLLIPNKKKLKIALNNNIENMSFISSFSNNFQKKNIKKTLEETKNEIKEIDSILVKNNLINNKLYLSCFNHCPIDGYIDDSIILQELIDYDNLKSFNEFCLSDTTGNLSFEDFKRLIHYVRKIINTNKLSLHLHINKDNLNNSLEIIEEAFRIEITKLDISCIDEGGCSVTMNKNNLNSNLSYDILEKLIN